MGCRPAHRRRLAFAALSLVVIGRVVAADTTDPQPWPEDDITYLRANLQFALAHELGHMFIEELDIPVLGGTEDAADQLAAMAFLEGLPGHRHDAAERRLYGGMLGAVAAQWRIEWALARLRDEEIAYWDEHPLHIQRFYNIACFIYGSDPDYYDRFVESVGLPPERARACETRFPAALRASRWVADTYGSAPPAGGGRLSLLYEPGRGDGRRALEKLLRDTAILSEVVDLVGPRFHLPRDITVVATNCLGRDDALWRDDLAEVVICYELAQRFLDHASLHRCVRGRVPDDAGEDDFIGAVAACMAEGGGQRGVAAGSDPGDRR